MMHNFHLDQNRIGVFAKAVHSLQDAGFANPLFFAETEIHLLRREASALPFRKAQALVGKNVYQDFSICFPAPLKNSFKLVAQMLEQACEIIAKDRQGLFESEVKINDFAVQSYPAHSRGIGIHKDSLRYRNLVFILTLDGQSDLFVCSDRQGTDRQVVPDNPGRLVIIQLPALLMSSRKTSDLFMVLIMLLADVCRLASVRSDASQIQQFKLFQDLPRYEKPVKITLLVSWPKKRH